MRINFIGALLASAHLGTTVLSTEAMALGGGDIELATIPGTDYRLSFDKGRTLCGGSGFFSNGAWLSMIHSWQFNVWWVGSRSSRWAARRGR